MGYFTPAEISAVVEAAEEVGRDIVEYMECPVTTKHLAEAIYGERLKDVMAVAPLLNRSPHSMHLFTNAVDRFSVNVRDGDEDYFPRPVDQCITSQRLPEDAQKELAEWVTLVSSYAVAGIKLGYVVRQLMATATPGAILAAIPFFNQIVYKCGNYRDGIRRAFTWSAKEQTYVQSTNYSALLRGTKTRAPDMAVDMRKAIMEMEFLLARQALLEHNPNYPRVAIRDLHYSFTWMGKAVSGCV